VTPMTRSRQAGALAILALALPSLALANSSGPINGVTGAPGEGTCVQCHNTFPLNSGTGSLTVSGIGATYTPGQAYTIDVTLADPDARRWGFELTALNAAGASVGSYALPAILQQSTAGNRTYVKHTSAGTFPGTPTSHTWQFTWNAPAAATGPVTFYVAGNAANNSGTNVGDRIYATSFAFPEFDPQVAVGDDQLPGAHLLGNFPNPFNPRTVISFSLPREQHVNLDVFTVDGRRVTTLVAGPRSAGTNEVTWDGNDDAGRAQPSGSYVYVMRAGETRDVGRMTLVR
jgi:hypothetical protein